MIQRYFLLFALISVLKISYGQNEGFEIKVTIPAWKDSVCYLAYHFGDKQYISDTSYFDSNGLAVFAGEEALDGGIYLFVGHDRNFFEFLVAEDQHFSLNTAPGDFIGNMKVDGSIDNQVFFDDLQFITSKRNQNATLNRQLALATTAEDSAKIKAQLASIDDEVAAKRAATTDLYPDMLYVKILKASDPIDVPDFPEEDSTSGYYYYMTHYFDNFDLTDDRYLRTPIYDQKLKAYLNTMPKHPDSIISYSDRHLELTRAHPEIFKYTLITILNEHANSKIMGMDKVYVHLVEKYYMQGEAPWMSEEALNKITNDALKLKPLLIGAKAPNITMKDMNNVLRSLHDVEADFTILLFWDADCGTCRKEIPLIHDLYVKTKDQSVKVYAISTELIRDHWDTFIEEEGLDDWMNLIDISGQHYFRDIYNIKGTPVVFLLDTEKFILAKRVGPETLEEVLMNEIKKKSEEIER